jgi:hypothetical protein
MYGINVVQGFSGSVVISILVAVPQIAGRNITDDKRNLQLKVDPCSPLCFGRRAPLAEKVAATSKKEGLRHSHFSFANIS